MPYFLYISDVFCRWCFATAPTILRIQKEHNLTFEVLHGELRESPLSFAQMYKLDPNIEDFIEKMYIKTKVRISDNYVNLLKSPQNAEIFINCQKSALLFYSLKHFAPNFSLEIMKDLQEHIYEHGRDVFSHEVLELMTKKYQIDKNALQNFMDLPETNERTIEEVDTSFDIMGDVPAYPTLYYVENKQFYPIFRGFTPYEICKENLIFMINSAKNYISASEAENTLKSQKKETNTPLACNLDGTCS